MGGNPAKEMARSKLIVLLMEDVEKIQKVGGVCLSLRVFVCCVGVSGVAEEAEFFFSVGVCVCVCGVVTMLLQSERAVERGDRCL